MCHEELRKRSAFLNHQPSPRTLWKVMISKLPQKGHCKLLRLETWNKEPSSWESKVGVDATPPPRKSETLNKASRGEAKNPQKLPWNHTFMVKITPRHSHLTNHFGQFLLDFTSTITPTVKWKKIQQKKRPNTQCSNKNQLKILAFYFKIHEKLGIFGPPQKKCRQNNIILWCL